MVEDDGLLGYEEVAVALGRSVGAVRNMKLRGRLPEPDAPGPKWRRESLAAVLAEGAPVPLASPPISGMVTPVDSSTEDTPATPGSAESAPETSSPPFAGGDAEDRRRRAMSIADVLACPHPAGDRKRLGYAVLCVRCGRREEGRDSWTGAGYAGWDAAKLAACPHPPAERRELGWGAACGVCGVVLR